MAVSLEGLHPTLMRPRVEALLADPLAKALGLYVVSAFRSVERQRVLYEAAIKKYGAADAGKWVAPPGRSNHGPRVDGYGTAVDLGLPGVQAVSGQWPPDLETAVNAIAARHGLFSPMEWEDWHFEPIKNWAPTPVTPPPQEDDEMPFRAIRRIDTGKIAFFAAHYWREAETIEEVEAMIVGEGCPTPKDVNGIEFDRIKRAALNLP
jgi:hypothetical protein